MIHQVLGGFQGQNTDIQIHAAETKRLGDLLNRLLSKHTGQPLDVIERDTNRDNFMHSEQAKAYGLIDTIFMHRD
jgi:ATP-dependent Clp protease protease subunit